MTKVAALVFGIALAMFVTSDAFARGGGGSSGGRSGGSHAVKGYTNKNGTYIAPHRQTNPNNTRSDNWSTKGNVNPYTGQPGRKNP